MIIPDKKKAVSVILSKLRPEGGEKSSPMKPEEEMDGGDSALKAIAEDVLMAFEQKSAHDLMVALKAFFEQMEDSEEGPEEADEE